MFIEFANTKEYLLPPNKTKTSSIYKTFLDNSDGVQFITPAVIVLDINGLS